MGDESRALEVVKRYLECVGADVDRAEEIHNDDAVLEFSLVRRAVRGPSNLHRVAPAVSRRYGQGPLRAAARHCSPGSCRR